ncbi:MAG: hypothetical protein ACI9UN_000837 [Granulosicoccus sp.]|jgi:hypothetical protein
MSIRLLLRSIIMFIVLLIAGLLIGLTWLSAQDRANPYPVNLQGMVIPEFDEQFIDFVPSYDKLLTLPFAAGSVIDIDNDGVEELFFGGGINQQDAFFRFVPDAVKGGRFENITAQTGWQKDTPDKTFSAVSLDLDRDSDNDMLVTRQSGVYLYQNNNGKFSGKKLDLNLNKETVPLSVAVGDINRDGLYDMYVSGYIARKYVQGETIFNMTYGGVSALYLNTGDDTFKNITEEAGMFYQHNTFQAVFIDVDNDKLEDLMVAHDTGQVRTWKNKGGLKFENMPNPTSDYFAYPMGIAVTDLKNNGLPDFFFSNVGSTVPSSLVRGDLREDQVLHQEWLMFENQGNFTFIDSAVESQLADFEFSWGAVFEDFNLDGRDDLVVSENYEGWPLHKVPMWRLNGRFMLQSESGEFMEAGDKSGVQNRAFGITPLTADFNQDGYPDLVHVNLLGQQKAFLSKGGNQGFLKVKLPNTIDSVGTEVSVTLDDGNTLIQTFVVGEGLVSDQSHILIFGLGTNNATKVSIDRLNSPVQELSGQFRNELLEL